MNRFRLSLLAVALLLSAGPLALPARASDLDDAIAELKKNPNDESKLKAFWQTFIRDVVGTSRSDPDKAEEAFNKAKEALQAAIEKAEGRNKAQMQQLQKVMPRVESMIEAGRKLKELVGKPAPPFLSKVEAWVNGEPLTEDDLKGKVVLLDFWAVWCGPCIATFPHLREWHEKYADKGLVIVGLTRYYNYTWNEKAGRASRSPAKVSPEDEQEMLKQFTKHHQLKHVIAVMTDNSVSEAFGVTGIPQVVVIDRDGKVRLIRVGSGPKNAHDVEEMIKKLIGEKA